MRRRAQLTTGYSVELAKQTLRQKGPPIIANYIFCLLTTLTGRRVEVGKVRAILILAAVEKRISDSQHDNPCLRRIKNVEETSTDGRGMSTWIKNIKKMQFSSWIFRKRSNLAHGYQKEIELTHGYQKSLRNRDWDLTNGYWKWI